MGRSLVASGAEGLGRYDAWLLSMFSEPALRSRPRFCTLHAESRKLPSKKGDAYWRPLKIDGLVSQAAYIPDRQRRLDKQPVCVKIVLNNIPSCPDLSPSFMLC